MRKKLALILNSTDDCFLQEGFSGGACKVTKNLIFQLIESEKFDIDIYCKKSQKRVNTVCGINSITVLGKLNFENKLKKKLAETKYNYVLSSDILLSFANNGQLAWTIWSVVSVMKSSYKNLNKFDVTNGISTTFVNEMSLGTFFTYETYTNFFHKKINIEFLD